MRMGSLVFAGYQNVSAAPDGLQVTRLSGIIAEFLAQPRDLNIDRAIVCFLGAALREVEQLLAAENSTCSFCKHLEQGELVSGQFHVTPRDRHAHARRI